MLLSRQHITIISTFLCFNAFHSVEGLEQIPKSASFEDVNATDWLHECATVFKQKVIGPNTNYIYASNYVLINKPSGLCADFLGCAFSRCNITNEAILEFFKYPKLTDKTYQDFEIKFPPLNLPKYITFPESMKDMKNAILNASSACIGVSIKMDYR